jgi:phenylacetate-coenzyme A ligase PaaK-like adenylate-forming protein
MSDRIVAIDGACACGRPFARIGGIEGRQEDVLKMRAPDGKLTAIHPNVFHAALELAAVGAWQVVQTGASSIRVLLAEPHGADEAEVSAAIRTALERAGVPDVQVAVERVATIPRTALGKAPLVQALR